MINRDVFFNVSASANFTGTPVYTYSHCINDRLNFKPLFPKYSRMSCEDVKSEIYQLQNELYSSNFSKEVNDAYQKALSDAQTQYIKCSIKASVSDLSAAVVEIEPVAPIQNSNVFVYCIIFVSAYLIFFNK